MPDELHWSSAVDICRPNPDTDDTRNLKSVVPEGPVNVMERSLVFFQDVGAGDIYQPQRLSLGNSSRKPLLLRYMEPQSGEAAYQHKGTVESVVCTEPQELHGPISVSILRKYIHTILCQEIRERNLPGAAGISIKVEICDPIPRSDGSINFTANSSTSKKCSSGFKKQKVTALGKKALGLDLHEYMRLLIETQDLRNYEIGFIVSKEQRVRRRTRYSSIQKRFIGWPVMDISAVIELLREWVQISSLTIKQITAKIFWLLSVTGFLSDSDIQRIEYQRIRIKHGVLNLVIVAPKEKRGGLPVEKPCQINPYVDRIIFPVNAYMVYKEKVTFNPFPTPQINNGNCVVHRLTIYVKDASKPLSVDSITRYIH
ncbi:hypothetical protein AYI70_g462 [Smittium culicis]|uniref:Uncharacterized protein n=1 Tax=Smittium culicis TaxID=133412 RepID=A0A1R1YGJ5_9FUNG|nr:hypothetical protein AYI70_g462 [Smittium culicis]